LAAKKVVGAFLQAGRAWGQGTFQSIYELFGCGGDFHEAQFAIRPDYVGDWS
jgi:hypothetical protein